MDILDAVDGKIPQIKSSAADAGVEERKIFRTYSLFPLLPQSHKQFSIRCLFKV